MAYCRLSDGDVYLYENTRDVFECYGCILPDWKKSRSTLSNRKEALQHLAEHLRMGHKVPRYAFERLLDEIYKGWP